MSLFSPINLFFSVERVEFIDLVEFEVALSKCSERMMSRVFQNKWTYHASPYQYFFFARKSVCFVCSETVALTKEPETALVIAPIINYIIGNQTI